MNEELKEEIRDSASSLLSAGWNVGKITTALSAYDSYGLKATSKEIHEIALAECRRLNRVVSRARAEAFGEIRQALSESPSYRALIAKL